MFSTRRMRKIGWLCFGLMWIPFFGIFVGMIGMPDGSYAWSELPSITRYSLVAVGLFMGLSLLFQVVSMAFDATRNRSLLEDGQTAEATILGIEPTGRSVNDTYHGMSFLLDVQPLNEPPFQARAERLVPMHLMAGFHIGSVIEVKFNPDTQSVAIPDPQHAAP